MTRAKELTRALAAALALAALLVAIPIVLSVVVGWPLPHTLPAISDIRWRLSNGQIPDTFWIKLLACIVWTAWAQLAAAATVEIVAVAARRPTWALPAGFSWAQTAAGRLVATAALIGTLATHTSAIALPQFDTTSTGAPVAALSISSGFGGSSDAQASQGRMLKIGRLDTLWDIADRTLGNGERALEIRDLNAGRIMPDGTVLAANFMALEAGWTLQLPSDATLPATESALIATHTVAADESFWTIAEHTLEDAWGRDATPTEIAPYWRTLIDTNREHLAPPGDPNVIFPNQTFDIPQPPLPPEIPSESVPTAPNPDDPPPLPTPQPAPTPTTNPTSAATSTPPPTTSASRPASSSSTRGATSAPTNLPVSVPPTTPPNDVSQPNGDHDEGARPLVVLAGCGLLAAAVMLTLRRLRRAQMRRRRHHTQLPPLSDTAQRVEVELRSIARTDATEWLDTTLRFLAARYHDSTDAPRIALARAGTHGVEFLLEQPAAPPDEFICSDLTSRSWRLDPDLDLDQLRRHQSADANPFSPALVTIGTTSDGELLIDLETLAVLRVDGDPDSVSALLRAMSLAATTMPWSKYLDVITIGIERPPAAAKSPDDPTAWVSNACNEAKRLHEQLDVAPRSTRLRDGDVWYPTIVFVGPGNDELAAQLAQGASLARSALVVVAASELDTPHRLVIQSTAHATFEPFGIALTPITAERETIEAVDELLEHAHQVPPHPIDIHEAEPESVAHMPAQQPSAETLARIEAIDALCPIEVQLLTRVPAATGLLGNAPAKLVAVIAFLALHRRVPTDRLRSVFWTTASSGTFNNNMAAVRKLLGANTDGEPRLPGATNTREYVLSDEVATDWHRGQQLICAAKHAIDADAIEYLTAALGHVSGWPLADADDEHYHWILDELQIRSEIETTLIDAAERLGAFALQQGNTDLARWAAHQGHLVVPGQESLYRLRMRGEHLAGNHDGIVQAYKEAVRAVEAVDDCDEVQPETRALYKKLMSSQK